MLVLIKNEAIKFFRKPKTILLLVLAIVVAIGWTFILYVEGEGFKKRNTADYKIKSCEEDIQDIKGNIKRVEKELETVNIKEIEKIKEELEYNKDRLKESNKELEYWKKEKVNPTPWQKNTEKDVERSKLDLMKLKGELANLKKDKSLPFENKKQNMESLEEKISLTENNLILYKDSLEKNIERTGGNEFEPVNLLMTYYVPVLAFLIPLFIALFGSDIVSDESTNETFKFLLIQPVSRMKILMAKFILLVGTLLILIMGTQLIGYLFSGTINGFDKLELLTKVGIEFEYDGMLVQEYGAKVIKEIVGSGYYITMKELIVQVLLLQALFIIAGTALVFFITTVCKSSMISMAASVLVLFGGTVMPAFIRSGKFMHLSFLGYNNPLAVIEGNIAQLYENIMLRPQHGMVLMIASTVILLILSNMYFKRKDILA